MKKLEAKTKEQQDYIAALAEEESCDGEVKVCEGGIDYTVDQCFGVGISFDTMAEIVDYLRNEPVREDLGAAADRCMAERIIIHLKGIENDYLIDLTEEMEWIRNQVKKGEDV